MKTNKNPPPTASDIEKSVYRYQLQVMNNLVVAHGSQDERTSIYTGIMMALVQVLWADRDEEVIKTPEAFMNMLWLKAGCECLDTVIWYEKFEAELAEGAQPTTDQVGSA